MSFLRKDVIEGMSDEELNKHIEHLEWCHKTHERDATRCKNKLEEAEMIKRLREKPTLLDCGNNGRKRNT